MIYKHTSILFIIFNLVLISDSYSKSCPLLNENQLKSLMKNAEANKEGGLHRDSSQPVSINGEQYRMKYSAALASEFSSVVSSSKENKIKIEQPTQERSEIQKIEGPQANSGRRQMPSSMHLCKYKVLVPKIVYEPLAGGEEVEIYTLKDLTR